MMLSCGTEPVWAAPARTRCSHPLFAGLFYLHRVGNPVEAFSKSREEIRAFEEKVGDKWVAVSDRFWGAVTQVRTPVRVFYSHVT